MGYSEVFFVAWRCGKLGANRLAGQRSAQIRRADSSRDSMHKPWTLESLSCTCLKYALYDRHRASPVFMGDMSTGASSIVQMLRIGGGSLLWFLCIPLEVHWY